jgi:hypothetical protein
MFRSESARHAPALSESLKIRGSCSFVRAFSARDRATDCAQSCPLRRRTEYPTGSGACLGRVRVPRPFLRDPGDLVVWQPDQTDRSPVRSGKGRLEC